MATIACPACQRAAVQAPSWTFSQTSVEVPACSQCRKAGTLSVEVKTSAVQSLGDIWDELIRPKSREEKKAIMADFYRVKSFEVQALA